MHSILVNILMNSDKFRHLWDHHHDQDTEHFLTQSVRLCPVLCSCLPHLWLQARWWAFCHYRFCLSFLEFSYKCSYHLRTFLYLDNFLRLIYMIVYTSSSFLFNYWVVFHWYTTIFLFIHHLMNIWVVYNFLLLWVKLL